MAVLVVMVAKSVKVVIVVVVFMKVMIFDSSYGNHQLWYVIEVMVCP